MVLVRGVQKSALGLPILFISAIASYFKLVPVCNVMEALILIIYCLQTPHRLLNGARGRQRAECDVLP